MDEVGDTAGFTVIQVGIEFKSSRVYDRFLN